MRTRTQDVIREALEGLIPGGVPSRITVELAEALPDGRKNTWSGAPDGLAEVLAAALADHLTAPMTRTEALKVITEILKNPVGHPLPAEFIGGLPADYFNGTEPRPKPWMMHVAMLAQRITAQLPFGDDSVQSPLAAAEDAKRRRDLVGEVGALMDGYAGLTTAAWYPNRPGDLVHVHYEGRGTLDQPYGETYLISAGAHGFLSMRLLAHTLPEDHPHAAALVGCYAVDDDPDPLAEMWMEAGSHRLTVVRDGRPVHVGGAR